MKKSIALLIMVATVIFLSSCSNQSFNGKINEILNFESNVVFTSKEEFTYFENSMIFSGVFNDGDNQVIYTFIYDIEDDYFMRIGEYICTADCAVIGYVDLEGIDSYLVIFEEDTYYFEQVYEEDGLGKLKVIEYKLDYSLENLKLNVDVSDIEEVLSFLVSNSVTVDVIDDDGDSKIKVFSFTIEDTEYALIQDKDRIYVEQINN